MEAQSALVGADGAVELDAEAAVDVDFAEVVHPGHAELNHALGLDDALEDLRLDVFRMALHDGAEGHCDFLDRLQELRFVGIALTNLCEKLFNDR